MLIFLCFEFSTWVFSPRASLRIFNFASFLQSRKTGIGPAKLSTNKVRHWRQPEAAFPSCFNKDFKLLFLRKDKLPETRASFLNSCSQNSDTDNFFNSHDRASLKKRWQMPGNNRNHLKLQGPVHTRQSVLFSVFINAAALIVLVGPHTTHSVSSWRRMFLTLLKLFYVLSKDRGTGMRGEGQGNDRGGRAALIPPRMAKMHTKLLEFNNSNAPNFQWLYCR